METLQKSKILKKNIGPNGVLLSWDRPNGGIFRYLVGIFLLAWLGGWAFILLKLGSDLLFNPKPNDPLVFLIVWLICWTLGGIFAMVITYLTLRPQRRESIKLNVNDLEYDSGTTTPITIMMDFKNMFNPFLAMARIFQKRTLITGLNRTEVKFVLEKNPSRVYFDKDCQRFEIGKSLSEPEIEWLHKQLHSWSNNSSF